MKKLRFRQVHLDFHTSEHIPGIGAAFDKREWQERLQEARVDSITCFSLCHHGWSYHPTRIGKMHPNLDFDLLRAQMDACREIDVKVPVYLSAGLNSVAWAEHPEWHELDAAGRSGSPLYAGFRKLCFNTPYLDYLCALIGEAAELFPEGDGIFLDIIHQGQCCCKWCMAGMLQEGLDPELEADRIAYSRKTLLKYYEQTTAAARRHNPAMPVFHNSGHITPGDTAILQYFSHLELESLPTGGWGYDHFPLSAAYSRNLGLEFLGMTGKFHTTWGEFGGFKHPNALRYECAAMLAQGAKCSVGDQLHPDGQLNRSTYKLIGAAYREVEAQEPWCEGAASAAAVAVLSSAAEMQRRGEHPGRENRADIGAARLLLECHFPFDFIDFSMSFNRYRVLVLPDDISLDAELEKKLSDYLAQGGKAILSGGSGLRRDGSGFGLGLRVGHEGVSEFNPDYLMSNPEFAPSFIETPFVMYAPSQRIKVTGGRSLGQIYDPYFNRTYRHFCSHQHTPYRPEASGYDGGLLDGQLLYFAHPVFSLYRAFGAVAVREFAVNAIAALLGDSRQIRTNLPSQARVTLMQQPERQRYVLHLLYADTILRGGREPAVPDGKALRHYPLEVIEDLNPLYHAELSVALPEKVSRVTLEPQGSPLPFEQKNGQIALTVSEFTCHQMVVFHY